MTENISSGSPEAHPDDSKPMINITIKTQKDSERYRVSEDIIVSELKKLITNRFNASLEQLCLIFAGKILKDQDDLKKHKIKNGFTIHLIIREVPPPTAPTPPTSNPFVNSNQPLNMQDMLGTDSLGSMGSFSELQRQMENEILNNPALVNQLLNPDYIRTVFANYQPIQDIFERNPELVHMLNNPVLVRQTIELSRNPALLQEMMRSNDRAMSNLESFPGGYNALERMYRDIQEPLLSATNSLNGPQTDNNNVTTENPQLGNENSNPLPNPWPASNPNPNVANSPPNPNDNASSDNLRNMLPRLLEVMRGMERPSVNPQSSGSNINVTNENSNTQSPTAARIENPFTELLARITAQNQQRTPPEELYRVQLEQLESMGFTNRAANVEALTLSFGDINGAIQRLVGSD